MKDLLAMLENGSLVSFLRVVRPDGSTKVPVLRDAEGSIVLFNPNRRKVGRVRREDHVIYVHVDDGRRQLFSYYSLEKGRWVRAK